MRRRLLVWLTVMSLLAGTLCGCSAFLTFDEDEDGVTVSSENEGESETAGATEAETAAESVEEAAQSDEAAQAAVSETIAAAETAAAQETTQYVSATLTAVTYQGAWENLSNEVIPFGLEQDDRDENNIPNGVYYYKNLYAQYGADFIQDTSKKVIYLTYDAGYDYGTIDDVLDVLKEKNVKAVFFLIRKFAHDNPTATQRIIDEGHIIGNHTTTHMDDVTTMPEAGPETEIEQVMTFDSYMQENFGYKMTLFRFPYGTFSEQSLSLVHQLGYHSIFYSFDYLDYDRDNQPDPDDALDQMLSCLHPGAIYMFHLESYTDRDVLGDFIDGARAQGYEFGVYPTSF